MEKLIIHMDKRLGRISEYFKSPGDTFTIGRGLNCELILSDHFISPEQVKFQRDEQGWSMQVLDQTNPVLINNQPVADTGTRIVSGDVLTMGRTHLTLLLSNHSVEKTKKLIGSNWDTGGSKRYLVPFIVLAVAVILGMISEYMSSVSKVNWDKELSGGMLYALILIIWAGAWALAGRLLKHRPNFLLQLFYTSLVMGLSTIGAFFAGYTEYITTSSGFASVIETGFIILIFSVLLKYNLMYATELKRCGTIAFSFVTALTLFTITMSLLEQRDFSSVPDYSGVVKPPFAKIASGTSEAVLLESIGKQFELVSKEVQESALEDEQEKASQSKKLKKSPSS